MYKGWITANNSDEILLKELGIKIISRTSESICEVEMPNSSLDKLDKYWGNRFYWGLNKKEVTK